MDFLGISFWYTVQEFERHGWNELHQNKGLAWGNLRGLSGLEAAVTWPATANAETWSPYSNHSSNNSETMSA